MSATGWIAVVSLAVWATAMLLIAAALNRTTTRRCDELERFVGMSSNRRRQLLKRRRRKRREQEDPMPHGPRSAAENRYTRPDLYDQETRGDG